MIRASHIFPVYPLTQDIMPGDIFLVSSDIDDTSTWEESGFLPLDHHVMRLYPTGYEAFYRNSWPRYSTKILPREWLGYNNWSNAPVAGFPSYSFNVKQGAASSVALPIQGIPFGLSLMGARSASGFVTLSDAHTYGVDEFSLRTDVYDHLTNYQAEVIRLIPRSAWDSAVYLQVVSRVYTVGGVSVSMIKDDVAGVSLSGGSPKNPRIPEIQTTNVAANYSNLTSMVTSVGALSNMLPGGTLNLTSASSSSVSMRETFQKPVAIGYVGFSIVVKVRKDSFGDPHLEISDSMTLMELANTLGRRSIARWIKRDLKSVFY